MKKVVVAESSPTIKSVADSLLRQSGYDVVCTSDGLQAWEVILSEKPDLVLAGLSLSGISGLDLCRQITSDRLTGGIPVVLMLGANDTIREEELVASGARGRLKKPFSPKDLIDIAGKLAGQRAQSAPIAPMPNSPETKFVTQVSSTQHLRKKQETYNLEWLDLNDSTSSKNIAKVASFDVGGDDQSLVIDDDQYGLANPIIEPEEPPAPPKEEKDSDYDWFVGEMKREIEAKKTGKLPTMTGRPLDAPKISSDIGFEDIRPSDPLRKSPPQDRDTRNSIGASDFGNSHLPNEPANQSGPIPKSVANMTDERIAKIADQVAIKLAAHLVSHLDKNLIIEVIKTELKL